MARNSRLLLVGIVGFCAGTAGAAAVLLTVPGILGSVDTGGHALILAEVKYYFITVSFGVLGAGTAVTVAHRRHPPTPTAAGQSVWASTVVARRRVRIAVVGAVVLAYAVTWAGRGAAAEQAFVRETRQKVVNVGGCDSPNPRIETIMCIPALPGVVLAWQERQMGGQCGWGGWKVYFWCGGEARELYSATRWVS